MSPLVCYKLGVVCSQCYFVWKAARWSYLLRESGAQMHNATQSTAGDTATGRLHCNLSFFRMLQRNRSILRQNCIFSCPLLFRPHLGLPKFALSWHCVSLSLLTLPLSVHQIGLRSLPTWKSTRSTTAGSLLIPVGIFPCLCLACLVYLWSCCVCLGCPLDFALLAWVLFLH